MRNLKNKTNEQTENRNTFTDTENKAVVTSAEEEREKGKTGKGH